MNNHTIRELAHRRTDGIDVTMLWDSTSNRVTVSVEDSKQGEQFSILVASGERPLDVFHHPFAYAAQGRRLEPPALAEAA